MNRTKSTLRKLSWPILVAALASPILMNCGGGMPGGPTIPGGGGVPGVPGACPDLASASAVANVDFAKEFKIEAAASAKLKAGLQAAAELKEFSASIDSDLKAACGGLAKDLGDNGNYNNGETACKAAIKAMGDAKAKLGAKATMKLDIIPPRCEASMDVMSDCAAKCDASVKPGSVKVECEPGKLSGSCTAECSGSCDLQAAAKCDGTCEGSCDASFKGSCGGDCKGKCDGKDAKGTCNGTCEGSCDTKAKGECKGKCGGRCELKAKAKCDGTCTGSCSTEMKAPKCAGEVKPPEVSAECKAHCDVEVNGKAECKPASVTLLVEGATDSKAVASFRAAVEKNLPAVLKIAMGMAGRADKIAGSVSAVVEGLQGSVEGIAKASSDPTAGARLGACVAAPFKGALDAAASVKANVSVSVDVKASASGSASGKAG